MGQTDQPTSESGDTPARQGHCAHHDHQRRRMRRRRILVCVAFAVLVFLLLAAAAAIVVLVVLRPRDPAIELLSANVTGVLPGVVTLPAVSVQINVTLHLVVRVRNPNPAAFRHDAATATLLYRGAAVGGVDVPAGTVPSRGTVTMSMKMTVQADRLLAAVGIGGLIEDALDGEMEFETRTELPGQVVLLGFIKRRVEARSVCRVVVGVADAKVRRQECHYAVKL